VLSDTGAADLNANDGKTITHEKTQMRNPNRSVIKIPLQEIDSSEEADTTNRVVTPEPQEEPDIKSENIDSASELQNKVDSPAREQWENTVKSKASPENLIGNLDSDVLCDKSVTFGPNSEKEPESEKKRAKSQNRRKKEHKRSGKNRVKSS